MKQGDFFVGAAFIWRGDVVWMRETVLLPDEKKRYLLRMEMIRLYHSLRGNTTLLGGFLTEMNVLRAFICGWAILKEFRLKMNCRT